MRPKLLETITSSWNLNPDWNNTADCSNVSNMGNSHIIFLCDHSVRIPGIKQIHFNEKTGNTAIVWDDGSEATVVKCGDGEKFERYSGFCAAVAKKLFGSTSAVKRMIDKYDVDKVKAAKEAERQKKAAEAKKIEEANRAKKEAKTKKELDEYFKLADEYVRKGFDMESLLNLLNGRDTDGDTGLSDE